MFAWNRGVVFFTSVMFVLRTQEELRLREEDLQTITVEVELKRHDSEPSISVPEPADETRYNKPHKKALKKKHACMSEIQQNTSYPSLNKRNNKHFALLSIYSNSGCSFLTGRGIIKFEYRWIYTKKTHLSQTSLTITESKCFVTLNKGYAGLITINHLYASVCWTVLSHTQFIHMQSH